MSRSLSVSLAYGFNIGGSDSGYLLEEYDDENYVMRWPDWVTIDDPDDEFCQPDDLPFDAERRLDERMPGHGIKLISYGRSDWMGDILGFELASGKMCEELPDGWSLVNRAEMDRKLFEAVEHLGLHPRNQPEPRLWLLASYW